MQAGISAPAPMTVAADETQAFAGLAIRRRGLLLRRSRLPGREPAAVLVPDQVALFASGYDGHLDGMFFHHKDLAFTVRVDKPNPVFARMLQQAIGGPEGEIRVTLQYLFQGWGYRGPDKYRDMILSTATEEIGHIEVLATAVAMNLEGAKSEQVDDVVTNPVVAARMGALEPRHFLTAGLAAMPSDANGVPFNASCIDVGGNLIANMRAKDDPGMKDLLRFLIARDTMHQQQWLAVLEELEPEVATNAPGDFENTDEFADHAYNFINHHLDTDIDPTARFATGPSLDGKGEFRVVEPASASAPEPDLQKAPPEVHAGLESTAPAGVNAGGGIAGRFTRLATDVADKLTPGEATGDPYEAMTKEELLEEARDAGIEGHSQMSNKQLVGALRDR